MKLKVLIRREAAAEPFVAVPNQYDGARSALTHDLLPVRESTPALAALSIVLNTTVF
jgi:hypothetical protein